MVNILASVLILPVPVLLLLHESGLNLYSTCIVISTKIITKYFNLLNFFSEIWKFKKFFMHLTIRQSRYIPGDDEWVGGGGGDLWVRDHLWGTLLSGDIGRYTQSTPSKCTGLQITAHQYHYMHNSLQLTLFQSISVMIYYKASIVNFPKFSLQFDGFFYHVPYMANMKTDAYCKFLF